ncbi:MAG TPA: tetratricopeptide repeat protein [Terriglobales bacterium]|jgi:tetratricopeptide (TPR) repeat protein|nr:tetratricopeptide repeat protein [Terriglobales bacterium]
MGVRKTDASLPIDAGFLAQLQRHVAAREIERGIACLASRPDLIAPLDPSQGNSARLMAHLAIWTDIGFSGPPLRETLKRFAPESRSKLSITDYICLRMAEGMVAMAEEAMESALGHFDFVLGLGEELDDEFLLSIAYFWKGRCLRRRGEYDEALIYTGKGRDLALELGHPRMAAVMQVLEGWLLFQQGKWKEAVRISQIAERALGETDDYVTLGNIQSFYGRMARREGRFDKAIEFFESAIRHYGKRDPKHPNLARSLANMALAKRGIALQLQKRIDREVQRRRKTSAKAESGPPSGGRDAQKRDYRDRVNLLRREALEHLKAAQSIYQQRPSHHGVGTVYLNAAYIHLDGGDFQRAEEQAGSAYETAEAKQDYILMVRARILQCMIANAKVEEEIGEGPDPGSHARRAFEFSQEAVELAKHTQHHLLLANAHVWQGLTQCNSFFDNPEAARASYDLARASCGTNQPDNNMLQDLQTLGAKILRKGSVHPALKAWSQGAVGDKTFRQISEEFAEIVIARVWEREGRKVSRAATRLSISPKKVRRILARVGRRKPR